MLSINISTLWQYIVIDVGHVYADVGSALHVSKETAMQCKILKLLYLGPRKRTVSGIFKFDPFTLYCNQFGMHSNPFS